MNIDLYMKVREKLCVGSRSDEIFKLRAQIAAQLFVGSVRNEKGAKEAVEEADMLLKELLK